MFKVVIAIDMVTAISSPTARVHRAGGWSESVYDADDLAKVKTDLATLCTRRAALLPVGFAITKTRVQQVNPVGAVQAFLVNYPGQGGVLGDIPQMALGLNLNSQTSSNRRYLKIGGIPDAVVVEGEYIQSQPFHAAYQSYINWLAGYYFRGRVIGNPTFPITDITPVVATTDGSADVRVEGAAAFTVGQRVRILRTNLASGEAFGGVFTVTLGVVNGIFRINRWTSGATTGGKVRVEAVDYFRIAVVPDAMVNPLVTTRKVGRPSVGFHGRVSRRR